jgi:hypothetical protein
MEERDWFSAILTSILAAGIAAAQGTEANSAVASTAPISLPGEGLAQHPFLYCGEWQQRGESEQTMYLVREGKVVWSYSIPSTEELGDCTPQAAAKKGCSRLQTILLSGATSRSTRHIR